MTARRSELVSLLKAFVYGDLRSVEFVGRIEDAILDELDRPNPIGDQELLNHLLDLVSRYVEHPPQDEAFLYGPEELIKHFTHAVRVLD